MWYYLKLCFFFFSFFENKKILSILFNVQKHIKLFELLLCSHFVGALFFVCLFSFVFCNAAPPKACWELSDHYASCFVGNFFVVNQKAGGKGEGVCMALSLSVYCTFLTCGISIAKPTVL